MLGRMIGIGHISYTRRRMMRRIALLCTVAGIFLAASVANAAPYLLTWNEEKQAYHLELTFSYENPNGPDVENTDNFVRANNKYYQNADRVAYGLWSFALEDGQRFKDITFNIQVTQSSKVNSRQESYFSTDPTIQEAGYGKQDTRYYLGDVRAEALIGSTSEGMVSSGTESFDYTQTFNNFDASTAYFLHWFRNLNKDDLTSLRAIEVTATAVPEPGTLMLLGIGASAVFLRKKRS